MTVSYTVMSALGAAWLLVGDWGMNGFVTTETFKELWFLLCGKRKNQDPLLLGATLQAALSGLAWQH